jgi:hypothetical protein
MRRKHLSRVAVAALAMTSLAVACGDDDEDDVDVEDPAGTVSEEEGTTETTTADMSATTPTTSG